MYTNIIWLSGSILEAIVLFRGWKSGLLRRYPFFYIFLAWDVLTGIVGFWFYARAPKLYPALYWDTQLVTHAASYGVCFEVFDNAFQHSRGVARAAQKALSVLFVGTFAYAACDLLSGGFGSVPRAAADLGCYLSYIEATLLLVMLWLFGRYRISLGLDLLGLIVGYSLWVGIGVMVLAWLYLPGHGESIGPRSLRPLAFDAALAIWCVSLWRPQPEPALPPENAIARDYQHLKSNTKCAFAQLFARATKAFRI
jgi:hypothetical protein